MKSTPLKRRTKPLRRRSKKMEAIYAGKNGRRAFVREFLDRWAICFVQWQDCTGRSQDVHEWYPRGIGGAIVPGDKADRQQQRFIAICRRCHSDLDLQPARARAEGWLR